MNSLCKNVNIGQLSILGNVVLEDNSLFAGVMGMADVTRIDGNLNIIGNNELPNLMGLNSLTTIGGEFNLQTNNVRSSLLYCR